jgi:uncharacterized protein YjbJ (UPF0337 family)
LGLQLQLDEEKQHMTNDDLNRTPESEQTDDKNLGRQGMADQMKGKLDEAAGHVQKKVGEVTNNDDMQADGTARELKGKMEQGAGKVERAADDVLDR